MGAPPKADWREERRKERRKRAWVLKQNGWPQKQVAAALGGSEGAISQWLRRAREGGGVEALTRRPPPGMTARLSAEQRAQLPTLLARGAPAEGFSGDVWTATRVAVVIERTVGVRYSGDHVSRIVRACGWSRQQPSTRAPQRSSTQRDEAKRALGTQERWPTLKKGPTKRGRPSSG